MPRMLLSYTHFKQSLSLTLLLTMLTASVPVPGYSSNPAVPSAKATAASRPKRAGVPDIKAGAANGAPVSPALEPQSAGANNALRFDGTDDYVTFGNSPSLGLTTFTIETWFKWEGGGSGTFLSGVNTAIPLIAKGRQDGSEGTNRDFNYFLGIVSSSTTAGNVNKLIADFENSTNGNNSPIVGLTNIQPGVWYHAAATYDGSTKWQLFLNGNLEKEVTLSTSQSPRSDSIEHAAIGSALNSVGTPATSGVSSGFFHGVIDEARIWNGARTAQQIKDNMCKEVSSATGLVGRWGLNEGSGTTTADSSGQGNTGTLTNGPTWMVPSDAPFVAPPSGNYALDLGGTNAYVTLGNPTKLGLTTFTLETWFKRKGSGDGAILSSRITAVPLVTKGRDDGGDNTTKDINYFLGIVSASTTADNVGKLVADFEDMPAGVANGGINHEIVGTTIIADNVWYHAAATYNGTKWQLFLNGNLEKELTVSKTPRSDSIEHAAIGSALNSVGTPVTPGATPITSGFFHGVIDEARIWNYARSAQQILNTKDIEVPSATGLVGRWGLNEGCCYFVGDTSNAPANGSVVGSSYQWVSDAAPVTQFFGNHTPLVENPGNQTSVQGDVVNLPIFASDIDGDALTFSATGLPPGLAIDANTGVISGSLTTFGTYNVTVTARDPSLAAGTASFTWAVTLLPAATASLVRTIDTSLFNPGSPDPSGITYIPSRNHLLIIDSEVDETTGAGKNGVNIWELTLTGAVTDTGATLAYTSEPTGVAFDPAGNRLFISTDEPAASNRIYVVQPGPDGRFGTSDDTRQFISTSAFGATDTEDPEFDPASGHLFFLNGVTTRVFNVDPVNGVFGDADDAATSFDVGQFGASDVEALTVDQAHDTLLVGDRAGKKIYELTKNGVLVRTINLSGVTGLKFISGLTMAPASDGSGRWNYWIVDRAVDNDSTPDENDGKIFEVSAPWGGNTPPVINSVAISPAAPNSNDTVTASVDARDDEGDQLIYQYQWFKNGAPLTGRTGASLDLSQPGNGDGGDSISVRVVASDRTSSSTPRTSPSVTVSASNSAPVAADDSYSVGEDNTLTVAAADGVLKNDTDADNNALSAVLVSGPSHAAASGFMLNANGSFTYTPAADYSGPDSFTYKASDGQLQSDAATVSITVNPANDAPTITDIADRTINEDGNTGALSFTVGDADTAAADLTVSGSSNNTSLVPNANIAFGGGGANRTVTVTPAANQSGTATITITVSDGSATSSDAFVLTVNPVNDAPSFTKGANQTAAEDSGAKTVADWATNISAGPGESSQVLNFIVTNNNNGLFAAAGQPAVAADGTLTYTPAPDANGAATVTVKLHDNGDTATGGVDTSAEQTFTITVTEVNDSPTADNDSKTTAEDTALAFAASDLTANDSAGPANESTQTLTVTAVGTASHGTVSLNSGQITYTPAADYSGQDSFTYTVQDNGITNSIADPKTATGTVNVTVTAVNRAPMAANQSVTTAEDTPKAITLSATDSDGDTLTYSVVTGPTRGTLSGTVPSLTYTPAANYNGSDSFTFKASDGTVDSNVATVSITVTAVNDAPVATNDSYSTNEDTSLNVAAPGALANDTDADGNPLTAVLVSGPVAAQGTLTLNSNGSFNFTPATNFNGTASFTYKANDGTADSNTATVTITVGTVNDAPVAQNDNYGTNEDTALIVVAASGVLANDTDADSTSLTAAVVSNPLHGTLALNANGSFTYTPAANYNGSDSFTYRASDGVANSDTATVTLTVVAVNDAPVVTSPGNQTNSEGDNVSLQIQASDAEADTLSYSATGLPGGLAINAGTGLISGTINFGAANNNPYIVQVTVNDGNGGVTNTSFNWTVVRGITFRSASFAQNGGATTLVIDKPSGLVEGNMMLASVAVRNNPIITAPGWTLIHDDANGTVMRQAIYYRVAGASEPASYTWTLYAAQAASGGIISYGGVDKLNPIDVANGQVNASSTSITAPSVTTTVTDARIVGFFGTAASASVTQPSSMIERGEVSVSSGKDKVTTESADVTQALAGTTGTRVATADKAAANIGQLVALKPAVAPAPPPTAPPPAPTNLTATAGNAQVTLNWNASAGATSYNVKRSTTSGGLYTPLAGGVTVTNYTDTTATNGTTYYYVVSAVNSVGEGDNSTQASATPCAPAAVPTGLTATADNAQVSLTWSASAGATSYNVKRSTTSGGLYTPLAGGVTVTNYTDTTSVTNGTTYYYVVSAVNSCGESDDSNQASATPQAPPAPSAPAAPSNLQTTAASSANVNLTWADNSNNEDGFKVERCTGAGCTTFVQIATNPPLGPNVTTYSDTGLAPGTTYRYRVRAFNSVDHSNFSNVSTVKTRR